MLWKKNNVLTELNIAQSDYNLESAKYLYEIIRGHPSLRKLVVSSNDLVYEVYGKLLMEDSENSFEFELVKN